MVRNADGLYVNKRSYDLQKIKEFDDREFEIPINNVDAETTAFLYRPDRISAVLKYVGPVDLADHKNFDSKRMAEMYLDAVLSQTQLDK